MPGAPVLQFLAPELRFRRAKLFNTVSWTIRHTFPGASTDLRPAL
ncbi:hypothetical protein [Roseomonas elaeocarpi]|uniref:Uncharacterized protein n=1 Tax=Roseomonas elaeocarpi TaxID=907779 RepID=A0ABV6JLQ7_9PROT